MSERRAIKEAKHERIRALLRNTVNMRSEQVVKDQQWLAEYGEAVGLPGYRTSQERPFPATRKAS